ncbi:CAP domain-containing protein [Bradyrhizobium sp. LHD-71]|uniref:CAP domain-containing protein n=1 Tax=Bradyrhizobium sp. LHD-71 TaxID=3072141 RepID=UPI0028102644|nr:CAP domain-containing protein [Bradyrhizobium sp. LHD-71]MDQ8729729.1 CAP domain-containing protein [Bradyrhizobium sp. LHD-71]
MLNRFFYVIAIAGWFLAGICNPSAALSASPIELISNFRVSQGLGRVTKDSTLDRIAQEQATAMAARDVLDHDLIGSFSSRVASSRSGGAAENIAYGHDSFTKTLDQWINSSGHRKNLLMPGASRVGVASAKSAKSGRTYWAMVIAGGYDQPRRAAAKAAAKAKSRDRVHPCRMSIMGLCLQRH